MKLVICGHARVVREPNAIYVATNRKALQELREAKFEARFLEEYAPRDALAAISDQQTNLLLEFIQWTKANDSATDAIYEGVNFSEIIEYSLNYHLGMFSRVYANLSAALEEHANVVGVEIHSEDKYILAALEFLAEKKSVSVRQCSSGDYGPWFGAVGTYLFNLFPRQSIMLEMLSCLYAFWLVLFTRVTRKQRVLLEWYPNLSFFENWRHPDIGVSLFKSNRLMFVSRGRRKGSPPLKARSDSDVYFRYLQRTYSDFYEWNYDGVGRLVRRLAFFMRCMPRRTIFVTINERIWPCKLLAACGRISDRCVATMPHGFYCEGSPVPDLSLNFAVLTWGKASEELFRGLGFKVVSAISHPHFIPFKKASLNRSPSSEIKKILLMPVDSGGANCMNYSDELGRNLKCMVQACLDAGYSKKNITVKLHRVMQGLEVRMLEEVRSFIGDDIRCIAEKLSPELLNEHDLVICNATTGIMEAACIGINVIVLATHGYLPPYLTTSAVALARDARELTRLIATKTFCDNAKIQEDFDLVKYDATNIASSFEAAFRQIGGRFIDLH